MTVMAMMQILFRMSLQGSIIIGIILLLRMVFRGLRISLPVLCAVVGNRFFLSYISMEDLAVCRHRPGNPLLVHGIPGKSHSHHRGAADSINFLKRYQHPKTLRIVCAYTRIEKSFG